MKIPKLTLCCNVPIGPVLGELWPAQEGGCGRPTCSCCPRYTVLQEEIDNIVSEFRPTVVNILHREDCSFMGELVDVRYDSKSKTVRGDVILTAGFMHFYITQTFSPPTEMGWSVGIQREWLSLPIIEHLAAVPLTHGAPNFPSCVCDLDAIVRNESSHINTIKDVENKLPSNRQRLVSDILKVTCVDPIKVQEALRAGRGYLL